MLKEIEALQSFVVVDGEKPVTDSRRVARHYGKRHSDVLRSISAMFDSTKAEIVDFAKRNFALCFENSELQNGKPLKFYRMTKDGFLELAMSFTGDEARVLRIRFIGAFNSLADLLRSGLWRRRLEAEAAYLEGKGQASVDGRGLRRWRDEKPVRLRVIAELDEQMQFCLPLN
ncbi:Rha family transcriptional regulator [Robbsia andropogonis]|uniref:Rha family transcriptional regulator n=1 Tax=Robbsia andropogonis TaxID=28092 RepID=UPI000465FFC4|nr:Rha family transcriptional regulator [Robbsia andropogonis]